MSTSEIFLERDEVEQFVRESKIHPQWFYGEPDRELGICPYITFYVYHSREDYLSVADRFITVWERFQELMDLPFQKVFKSRTQVWLGPKDKRFPTDHKGEAKLLHSKSRDFYLKGTDVDSPDASPRWSYSCAVDSVPEMCYSTLKMIFRYKWYAANNQRKWHEFIQQCVSLLQPEQCYMGFEVGNGDLGIMGSYEADVLERICADYFYGMDIDHPSTMGFHYHGEQRNGLVNPSRLGAGLRAPTWCFMLSPAWQRKLGKSEAQIRAELDDPRIEITAIPYERNALNPEGANGLWIRLGDLDLHPVENGVPDLLVKANRLIRPIRCDELNLNTLEPWDDDPNPRFDYETSLRWMRRFDEDSDWPNAQARPKPPAVPQPPQSQASVSLSAYAGEPCPQTGAWEAPRLGNRVEHVERGKPMPGPKSTETGAVVWYLIKQ